MLPALRRSPCLVSFSGGRDSSAVLAVAAAVARREGLPPPIPITHRFPGASGTDESAWQELVIRHVGVDDWLRVEVGSELEAIGPVAASVIARHGILWPCNSYFHDPIFEAAAGGAVLTGIGGDEAFMGSSWDRAVAVLQGRARPVPRDVLRIGLAVAPAAVKRSIARRRIPELLPWLRPAARREVEAWMIAEAAAEPLSHRRRLRRLLGSPALRLGLQGMRTLAADRDVLTVHPLHDAGFLADAVRRAARGPAALTVRGDGGARRRPPAARGARPLDEVPLRRGPLGTGQPRVGGRLGRRGHRLGDRRCGAAAEDLDERRARHTEHHALAGGVVDPSWTTVVCTTS